MKKTLLTAVISCILAANSFSQITKQWHFNTGSTGVDNAMGITTDANGNMYSTGIFHGTADFDPSSSVYNLSVASGHTEGDVFVQKLDANGNFLWAKRFGGTTNTDEAGTLIAVNDSGYVYVSGYYYDNIQFIANDTIWQSGTTAISRPFLVKLDNQGNVVWGYGWKYSANKIFGARDMTTDEWGNVYLAGIFEGSVDFDPTHQSVQLGSSVNSSLDGFIVKINPMGTVNRKRIIGSSGSDYVYGIDADGAHVYFTGEFSNTIDFDNGAGTVSLTSNGIYDAYITKVDTALSHVWAKQVGGVSGDIGYDIEVSNSGNVYSIGRFMATCDFDPNAGVYNLTALNNSLDYYILKLDSLGNFKWAGQFSGTTTEKANRLSISTNENIIVVGEFKGTIDLDPSNNVQNFMTNGGYDAYLVKLDSSGSFIDAFTFGASGSDKALSCQFINDNEFFVSGFFSGIVDLNPLPTQTDLMTSLGSIDMYMLKLGSCSHSFNTVNVTACGSYTLPSGNATLTQSGTYQDTLAKSSSCDSILTINLTVYPDLNATVTQTNNGLEANTGTNFTYQWLDCATNQPVAGATGQTLMPSINGDYAVIVDDGMCVDTSACYTINNVSISEDELLSSTIIYPNPTTGIVRVNSLFHINQINVLDLTGRAVISTKEQETVDLSGLSTGVYLIQVYTDRGIVVKRVVKR